MRAALIFTAFVLASAPIAARADTCPEVPDDEVAVRRSMAKEWFAKAEEAEAAGDRQAAIRRYACSLGLAPHPSTAYNLGTVAEKSGDLSMALDGFRTYLKLAPDASDRPAIEARIAALDAKVAELRKEIAPKSAVEAAPGPGPMAAAGVALVPVPAPGAAPQGIVAAGASPSAPVHGRRIAAYVTGASAFAVLGTGLVLNLMARSKMNSCYSQWNATMAGSALDLCDAAKPLAYTSYVLFGAGGVTALVSAGLFLWTPQPAATAEEPEVSFAPAPLPGGGALFASGRF